MINLITMLSLLLLLLLSTHFQMVSSIEDEEDEGDFYLLDSTPANDNAGRVSRFLTSTAKKVKKGTKCDAKTNPFVCNGVWADKGTSLLSCCKKHCRNILGDRNNCGRCGNKCKYGERCCGGKCTNVLYNAANCGKCGKKCRKGVKCDYGYCGYA